MAKLVPELGDDLFPDFIYLGHLPADGVLFHSIMGVLFSDEQRSKSRRGLRGTPRIAYS